MRRAGQRRRPPTSFPVLMRLPLGHPELSQTGQREPNGSTSKFISATPPKREKLNPLVTVSFLSDDGGGYWRRSPAKASSLLASPFVLDELGTRGCR
jgi:hypothetical protein